jgi:hypothetical protein
MPDLNFDANSQRLADWGPRYVETPPNPADYAGFVAEPWNTGSALLFVAIAIVWIWALRGRYRDHPFLTMCLPILLTGGIGGALYHGLRTYPVFFLMDVVPIFFLGLSVTMWLWVRLGPNLRNLIGVVALLAFLQLVARNSSLPQHWTINISYASLALIVVIPVALALVRTRFRYGGWVYTALACFAIAWTCRIADIVRPPLLPMGTHWLWHFFGALTTAAMSMYVFYIEGINLRRSIPAARADK